MRNTIITWMILTTGFTLQARAATLNWDMQSLWGISEAGFDSAIKAAHDHFEVSPNDTIIINIAAGTYNITGTSTKTVDGVVTVTPGASINFRNNYYLLSPADQGRLIFQGAGMDATVLVFVDTDEDQMTGKEVAHVTFRDMHFTRGQYTVSQGTVVDVNLTAVPSYIDLEIHDGFPTPGEILRQSAPQGTYLRRFTPSLTDPIIITATDDKNRQVRWDPLLSQEISTSPEGIVTWRMFRETAGEFTHYQIGEYVGIKSKHTGNNWFFTYSDDLVFENMKYTHDTRGVFRQGTSNVRFSNCRFERAPAINGQTPCLSSPGGGPQMGQPVPDAVSINMVVENCFFEGTGDDPVAFFHVDGGVVRDCIIRDSFARGILMTHEASNIRFEGNVTVTRGAILQEAPPSETVAPAQPTGLSLVDGSGRCLLSWDANTEPDLHYYQIYRQLDGVWWQYAITTQTSYDDLWALNGTIHSYYITAVDFEGNESTPTATIAAPEDYAMWIAGQEVTGGDALKTVDLESDGFSNYMEYALGGDPTLSDGSTIRPVSDIVSDTGSDYIEFIYRRRIDHVSRGISYVVETSTNLLATGWDTVGVIESDKSPVGDGVFEDVTTRVLLNEGEPQFMRLRID